MPPFLLTEGQSISPWLPCWPLAYRHPVSSSASAALAARRSKTLSFERRELSTKLPSPAASSAVSQPLIIKRSTVPYGLHAEPMKLLGLTFRGLKSGDPVCRPIRLSLSLSTWPALPTSGSGSPGSRQRGTLMPRPIPWRQASRFQPTFQVLFCQGPMLKIHALFERSGRAAHR
jgi:hypothetical protein